VNRRGWSRLRARLKTELPELPRSQAEPGNACWEAQPSLLDIEAEPLDKHSQAEPGNEEIEDFPLILARRGWNWGGGGAREIPQTSKLSPIP